MVVVVVVVGENGHVGECGGCGCGGGECGGCDGACSGSGGGGSGGECGGAGGKCGAGGGGCGGGVGGGGGKYGGGGGGVIVKDGMKTTRSDSLVAREPIVNRTRSTSEITTDNTVKTTGNGSTNIGEVIMPRIRNGSGKDFMTKSKENWGRISCVLGPGTKSL